MRQNGPQIGSICLRIHRLQVQILFWPVSFFLSFCVEELVSTHVFHLGRKPQVLCGCGCISITKTDTLVGGPFATSSLAVHCGLVIGKASSDRE